MMLKPSTPNYRWPPALDARKVALAAALYTAVLTFSLHAVFSPSHLFDSNNTAPGFNSLGGSKYLSPLKELQTSETDDVDVVITFVNGSEANWKRAYFQYLKSNDYNDERFMSYGEVIFSVASVDAYAPWIRKIFIVSMDQTFDIGMFIPTLREKIEFVPLSAIMPASALPTFSSIAIETSLHRIPGLSENFIYLNDDVLLMKPLTRADAFSTSGDGLSTFKALAGPVTAQRNWDGDWETSPELFFFGPYREEDIRMLEGNAAKLILEKFGLQVTTYWHAAHFLTKSSCQLAWDEFREYVNRTMHHKSRQMIELSKGGDVSFLTLARTLGVLSRFQVLDRTFNSTSFFSYSDYMHYLSKVQDYLESNDEADVENPPWLFNFLNIQNITDFQFAKRARLCFFIRNLVIQSFVLEKQGCLCSKASTNGPFGC